MKENNVVANVNCQGCDSKFAYNTSLDVAKYIMAILVVGIHTEPFGFNFWLDKGFGIFTRLCVPFFFVASGFLFWSKDKNAWSYVKRIFVLYAVWSVVYLPFDFNWLCNASIVMIFKRFCWDGNEHALWYLCGTIIGFTITYFLLKVFKPKWVFLISVVFLFIGCLSSSWSPLLRHLVSLDFMNYLGYRNGLFYAFPYISLGMLVAKKSRQGEKMPLRLSLVGFVISSILLVIESFIFVIHFKTNSTILWISVLPMTYFFFCVVNCINVRLDKKTSSLLRKMSTIVYVSHGLFLIFLSNILSTFSFFLVTSILATVFAYFVMKLSENKYLEFLKRLY